MIKELFDEYIDLRNKKESNKYEKLNKKYGFPYSSSKSLAESCRKRFKKMHSSEVTMKTDGSKESRKLIKMTEKQKNDPEELLKIHNFDPKKWTLISSKSSEWDVQLKGGETDVYYASKITVKPKIQELDPIDIYQELIKIPTSHKENTIISKNEDKEPVLLEIAFQDIHLGKLSWSLETGENYDHKIAIQRARDSVRDLLGRAKDKNIERIIFLIGGDMFHSDTSTMTTTAGTPLDNDLRWQKMFIEGNKLLIDLINEMLLLAPVDVITILGNHDTQTLMHTQVVLSAYYRNDSNVRVDMKMTPRKYYEYGKCLIGFTHGDKEGKRMAGIMQTEAAAKWGRTLYREIHAGHLHSEQTREENGLIIRNISSVTGTDSWHAQKGFVGAQKKLQAFIWNKNKGLMEIWNSPIIQKEVRKKYKDGIKELDL